MSDTDVVVNASTAEEALAKLLSAIEAIPEEKAMTCVVPGTDLVAASRRMVALLAEDKAAILDVFRSPPMADMEELEERSLAVWATEKKVEAADPKPATNLPALYREGGALKKKSVKVLDLLAEDDAEVQRTLKLVQPGTGYRDMADDLTALHPHLLSRRSAIVATTLMTDAEIDRIGEVAPLLLGPKKAEAKALKAARLLRNRAWTHYLRAYNEIRRHATFLHTDDQDKLDAYPNIFDRGGPKKKGK
jgi:hypothetical protein